MKIKYDSATCNLNPFNSLPEKFKPFIMAFRASASAHPYPFLSPLCLAFYVSAHNTSGCSSQITILSFFCAHAFLSSWVLSALDIFPTFNLVILAHHCRLISGILSFRTPSLSLVPSGLDTTLLCPWNIPCISLLLSLVDCIIINSCYVLGSSLEPEFLDEGCCFICLWIFF